MGDTKIEWADRVWNPVTGCTKVSQGCKNCYAERIAGRFWGERKFTDVMIHEDRLGEPLKWRKPVRVFVNSMSDLFHEDVSFKFIYETWVVMAKLRRHTFMILTKRPHRMHEFITTYLPAAWQMDGYWPLYLQHPNIWLGVSVEDQTAADERIPVLLQTPAAVHFVSCEPLLGPVDLSRFLSNNYSDGTPIFPYREYLDWVIAGGESGPNARPMHPDWVRSLRDQCERANVPFFFKQWGEWHPEFPMRNEEATCAVCNCTESDPCDGGCYWIDEDPDMRDRCSRCEKYQSFTWPDQSLSYRVGKKRAGRLLDDQEWNEFPLVCAQTEEQP